ncbi:polysaccharide deacetylase [Acetobacteraceae bacterium H6797]|nr:polysaccharide deacetylase [Acetobacteraceae bacterium H6797]
MQYDFVPMPMRKPLRWPNGARIALMLTTNLEYWDRTKDTDKPFYPGGPSIITDMLPGNVYDNPNWTWREYGQRVGVWRMYETFEKAGVPTSCTMNAKMGLERREVVQHAVDRGWEIVAHNYVQTDLLSNYQFDIEGERRVIRETLEVYEKVVGRKARGWLSCSLRSTPNTADILAEEGLSFLTDLLNDDQPYLIRTESGKPLVSIPYTSEVNDFTVFLRQGKDVDGAFRVFKEQFDELYREGASSGRLMNIGLHPHVIGQPFRIRALREFIDYAKGFPDVWWATREEIADYYLANHQDHIG